MTDFYTLKKYNFDLLPPNSIKENLGSGNDTFINVLSQQNTPGVLIKFIWLIAGKCFLKKQLSLFSLQLITETKPNSLLQ